MMKMTFGNIKSMLFSLLCLCSMSLYAQDSFTGIWESKQADRSTLIHLQIGKPEKNILYPAELKIEVDSFKATYHLVLARHNSRQLVLSKNKFPVTETPFSIGNWPVTMNGSFLFSKDLKGNPTLSLSRIITDKYGIKLTDLHALPAANQELAQKIADIFKKEEIELKKLDSKPWADTAAIQMFEQEIPPSYFGISDTIFVHDKMAKARFLNNKDIDIISLQLNGNPIVDQVDSKKSRDDEDFILDTGLNIICFFADDYGKNPPSSAAMQLSFDKSIRTIDFNSTEHLASCFIVAKVYRYYNEEDETRFETFNPEDAHYKQNDFPHPIGPGLNDSLFRRSGKNIGNIVSRSAQLTFAVWDDAVEDGDTISLSINDRWIVKGFPVLKKPQYITVTLNPGPNMITLVAENLGSIIPNTSILEIIDGKKRRSFNVETDLNQNNQLNIFYDVR